MSDRMPVVAVVGRPNVGKSTLFNRIVGEQAAIVENRRGSPATARSSTPSGSACRSGSSTPAVDAGRRRAQGQGDRQVEPAVHAADVVLFVVDARWG